MNDSTHQAENSQMKASPCLWQIIRVNRTATLFSEATSAVFVYADITIAVPDSNEDNDGEQIHTISTYGECETITKTNDEAIAIATKDAEYKACQRLFETV